jgi:hypothetical protein
MRYSQITVKRTNFTLYVTVKEILEAQKADNKLKHFFKHNATLNKELELQIIEDQKCMCNKGRLVIPTPLQGEQLCGTTTIFSTQGTTGSKEQ